VLIEALAQPLAARIRYGQPVGRVEATSRGVMIDGESFDGAVLAIPAEEAKTIVMLPELANRLAGFRRAPTALVYLGFPEAAVPRASDGFGALTAIGEDARVLGIVFESVVWSDRAPAGQVLLRCIFGGGRDPAATALDDAALIAQAVRDAGVIVGVTGDPTHASVIRWARGVAQYPVGHRDHVRAAVTAARTHKIALAGADYYGPGVNDLCTDTDRILDEVRAW
jgi:oxygen-dependent protoporphyrinogen oxidase